MWESIVACSAAPEVAFCIPWFGAATLPIYWYGILASLGIFVGAYIAARHVASEGEDPDLAWDALLWVLLAGLLGARLWYVISEVLGGSTAYSLARPIEILNPRSGGMNIFGGAAGGLISMYFYARARKIDGWLLADSGLLGLLIGQAIGRFGNLINQELYGPPTGSTWFGLLIRPENRLPQFQSLPPETRFHPTMMYEATWLILTFVVLYMIFRRNQETIVHGIMTGSYLIMAGVGRFIVEFWRPDQPTLTLSGGLTISYSHILSVFYVISGIVVVLDRMGHMRIPFIGRPQTIRQRQQAYAEIQTQRRRKERALERDRIRAQRLKDRTARQNEKAASSETPPSDE